MSKHIAIYPSVMCSKPWDLKDYLEVFDEVGVDGIHFDVMDGHFVPNITLGTGDFEVIRSLTDIPMNIHFMVEKPETIIQYFDLKENDMCSFHPEATRLPYSLLKSLRSKNIKAGLAISPETSIDYIENCLDVLDFVLVMAINPGFAGQKMVPGHLAKLAKIKKIVDTADHKIELIIDGNTTFENAKLMLKEGADGLVVGNSSIMKLGPKNFAELYNRYLNELNEGIK